MITGEPAIEWAPFEYLSVPLPAASGKPGQVGRPAVLVQARHRDSRPWTGASHKVQLHGIIDSGADTSVVPLRALRDLGAAVDDGPRRSVYGVAGILHAYSARIGLEIKHGRRRLDMGTVDVSVPDTEWSRDPAVAWPFVLGLGGFFDRFDVCISHARKAFRWARPANGHDRPRGRRGGAARAAGAGAPDIPKPEFRNICRAAARLRIRATRQSLRRQRRRRTRLPASGSARPTGRSWPGPATCSSWPLRDRRAVLQGTRPARRIRKRARAGQTTSRCAGGARPPPLRRCAQDRAGAGALRVLAAGGSGAGGGPRGRRRRLLQ